MFGVNDIQGKSKAISERLRQEIDIVAKLGMEKPTDCGLSPRF